MVTDASLLLYVDNSVSYTKEPERLFIYNTQTGAVLVDYQYDPTSNADSSTYSYLYHLGKLQKENGKGVASNIKNTNSGAYLRDTNTKGKILSSAVVTPLGTVIKDVKLRISYTQPK